MPTQYYTASSLDGFVATSDHKLDWLMQFGAVADSNFARFIEQVGALAMGSHTYEWLLHEAGVGQAGEPWPYTQPCWVFSTRELARIDGADIRFARGDVCRVHREMAAAAGGRNRWVVGGGELAGQFHDHGLLDELFIQIAPVTLGQGVPVLPRRIATPALRLTGVQQMAAGFVELRYAVPR